VEIFPKRVLKCETTGAGSLLLLLHHAAENPAGEITEKTTSKWQSPSKV